MSNVWGYVRGMEAGRRRPGADSTAMWLSDLHIYNVPSCLILP